MSEQKKRVLSGIQPTGNLHLGNYLGAVAQFTQLQDTHDALFCIVDLHAITVPQDPEGLRQNIIDLTRVYLASGLDPEKSVIFAQSDVSAHSELGWILNCTAARMGDMEKMTQFKDKAGVEFTFSDKDIEGVIASVWNEVDNIGNIEQDKLERVFVDHFIKAQNQTRSLNREGASVGLFDYPVLMAADILLYDTAVVPVGEDQAQHVELTRTLARRFNKKFGETFVVPHAQINAEGKRIMGLDDPSKKMSKSAPSEYNYIAISDDAEAIRKKIKKAVTDSGSDITYSDDRLGLKNLINIYSLLAQKSPEEIVAMYDGKGFGDFKGELAEVVVDFLAPLQARMAEISDDEVLAVLAKGAAKANALAKEKLCVVHERIGFVK